MFSARSTTSHAAVLAASVALAATLGACSSEPPKASELTNKAKTSSTSAQSVAVSIVGDVSGTRTTFDATGTLDGKNQRQVQTQGKASSDGIIVGDKAYLKANLSFWEQIGTPADTAKKLQGKWWVGSSSGTSSPALDVKALLNEFFSSTEGKKLASDKAEVKESTTSGQDTYTISDPADSGNAKLVVTRDEKPKVVKIEDFASKLTTTKATYTFSKWNSTPKVSAPAGAKPITDALAGK